MSSSGDLFDFTEALNEREAIKHESGIVDVAASFKETEMWRLECEARHCLDWYDKEERQKYLAMVEKHRGKQGVDYLKSAIMVEWKKRKDAA